MDIKALDRALQELTKKRNELKAIDYNDPKYDDLEEKLHDMEDDFLDKFGDDLEKILQDIHDKHCSDSDVLLPIAYLGDGAVVEVDKFPGKEAHLVLEANPPRFILKVGKDSQQPVWEGTDKK
ncbi:MAG TPA: hypothetical protein VFW11_06260 [Cyclobacteriaceae bacterium]|nr:hypothetical protein [Cyclobacteriaceae bacterium]